MGWAGIGAENRAREDLYWLGLYGSSCDACNTSVVAFEVLIIGCCDFGGHELWRI